MTSFVIGNPPSYGKGVMGDMGEYRSRYSQPSILTIDQVMHLTVCSIHARVRIAQWENDCISLSVLSVARVMIARWDPDHGEDRK